MVSWVTLLSGNTYAHKLDKVPPKSGTTGIPPTLVTGRGTQGTKIGTSRQKLDRWQPYLAAAVIW